MKQKAIYPKVATDMFMAMSIWTYGFMGIVLIVQIVKAIIAFNNGNNIDSYFNALFVATNVYMFVIGIISTYFLPYYVENGVTRKDFYKGALLSSVGLSIFIPVITFILSTLLHFILNLLHHNVIRETDLNASALDVDGNIIGDIVQSFIISPYVDPTSNWFLAIIVFAINILFFYLVGWIIGAGFYRFHTIIGLGFIAVGIVIITFKDTLLRAALELPIPDRIISMDILPSSLSEIALLLLGVITVVLLRYLTKNVSIKI